MASSSYLSTISIEETIIFLLINLIIVLLGIILWYFLWIKNKLVEIYQIVKEAQNLAIKAVKPGVRACDIDAAARDFIAKNGYGECFFHSTGHGVGLDIHEFPIISPKSTTIIEPGMVFSVEPGIYIESEFGVRIEDVVVVTNDGCEVI